MGEKSERRKKKNNPNKLQQNPYLPVNIKATGVPSHITSCIRQIDLENTGKIDDFEWVGDNLSSRPQHHVTRFLFLNCKGLPRSDMEFFNSFIRSIVNKHVHYCGLAEININSNNFTLKNKLTTGFESTVPGGLIHFNNSKVHGSSVEFQPGGVSSWFHGKLARKYMSVGYDKLGRWIYHQFQGNQTNLRVYTLYRVNPGSRKKDQIRLGSNNACYSVNKKYIATLGNK